MTVIPPEQSSVVLIAEPLRAGGLARYAASLVGGLPGLGLAPRLAAPEGPPPGLFTPEELSAVEVFPGLLGGILRPFVFRRFVPWARKNQPALIHGLSGFTAPACQRLAEALELPFVLSIHHYQDRGLRLEARCRKILACSEAIRENLVNGAHVPKELIKIVPVGIRIPPVPANAERTPAPPGRMPLVATFAPLTPAQDVATFLRAARRVQDALAGACQFLVIGDGPEEANLRRLVRELKLEKDVVFSHAAVPHDRVLGDVDVYVQTARKEGFGATVLQAMAWGRPVVATTAGGLIALVSDGETGYLTPIGDPEAVAGRVLALLGDPEARARLGRAGRAVAEREFSLNRMLEGVVDVYAEALGLLAPGPGSSGLRSAVA